jgi:O-antigen/teichoic acid export membrane protein
MTESAHSKRILRNMIYGFSTWMLPLFLGLVVTRVIVRSLGHSDYGIYALVLGFIAYSFNFSIGRAVTKYLASYRAAGQTEKIRLVISATAMLTAIVGLFGFLTILLLSNWLVVDVFEINAESQAKAIAAFRVSAATIFVLMVGQIATAVLQGLHRFDVFSKIQNAYSIMMMLGNLWLAYSGHGLVALLYWNLAATTAMTITAFFAARRLLPEFSLGPDFSGETIRLILRYNAGVVGYQIAANAFFLFERSWIIARLGAEALTFYVVPMMIGIYLHGFVTSLTMVLFPLASELDHDRERLLRLYRTATKGVMFVVVIIVVTLIVEGRLFLTLWMGPEFGERSATLLAMHSIAFGLAAIMTVSFQTAEGLGHPMFNFRNTTIGVLTAVPVVLGLTASLGLTGVAYGRLAVFIVPFLAILDLERRYLGRTQTSFWVGNVFRFACAGIVTAVAEWVVVTNLPIGWSTFLAATLVGVGAYVSVLLFTGFLTSDDRQLIQRLAGPQRLV